MADGRNIEEEVRNWLPKKSRTQRFDEVFQLMIIIEAILLEFAWTFVNHDVIVIIVILFIGALFLWATGTFVGDTHEYTIKTLGFDLSLILIPFLLLISIISIPAPSSNEYLLFLFTIFFVIPIMALFLSIRLISYLGTSVDRSTSLIMLISNTMSYMTAGFLLNLDKFI